MTVTVVFMKHVLVLHESSNDTLRAVIGNSRSNMSDSNPAARTMNPDFMNARHLSLGKEVKECERTHIQQRNSINQPSLTFRDREINFKRGLSCMLL